MSVANNVSEGSVCIHVGVLETLRFVLNDKCFRVCISMSKSDAGWGCFLSTLQR